MFTWVAPLYQASDRLLCSFVDGGHMDVIRLCDLSDSPPYKLSLDQKMFWWNKIIWIHIHVICIRLSAGYWPKICFDIRFNYQWLMVHMNTVCGFGLYTLMNFISTNRCFYLPHSGSQSFVTIKNNINHKDKRQIEDTDVIVTKDYWVFWTDFVYHSSD